MKNQLPAIEILEQAVNLLRSSPQTLLIYLVGAIPFTLGLLVFLNDMLLSPDAYDHVASASLGLAALYLWKNVWQAMFAARLYRQLLPVSPEQKREPLHPLRAALVQAATQPIGLAIPLPLPWLTAFFRNVALFATLGYAHAAGIARKMALMWTKQTWGVLAIVSLAFLLLFANFMLLIFVLPQLARSFLGVEGDFVRLGIHLLNPSTIGVALALAWLVADPVLDAVFVLRCFYGESIASGDDLRAALGKALATAALVLMLLVAAPHVAHAQTQPGINPADLDHSIDSVIHSRTYTWRSVRASGSGSDAKWVGWVQGGADMVRKFISGVLDAIAKWMRPDDKPGVEGGERAPTKRILQLGIGLVIALCAAGVIVFFLRKRQTVTKAEAVTPVTAVDLTDESLTADQLPESSWLQLAEDLLAKGDCRLALRALHLAGLNYLGERNLVSIRRWKSGLDYRRELERRARAKPELSPVFANNVALFERGWYGSRPVDREMVEAFAARLTEIRNYAG